MWGLPYKCLIISGSDPISLLNLPYPMTHPWDWCIYLHDFTIKINGIHVGFNISWTSHGMGGGYGCIWPFFPGEIFIPRGQILRESSWYESVHPGAPGDSWSNLTTAHIFWKTGLVKNHEKLVSHLFHVSHFSAWSKFVKIGICQITHLLRNYEITAVFWRYIQHLSNI